MSLKYCGCCRCRSSIARVRGCISAVSEEDAALCQAIKMRGLVRCHAVGGHAFKPHVIGHDGDDVGFRGGRQGTAQDQSQEGQEVELIHSHWVF
jgi:hypothetical protein